MSDSLISRDHRAETIPSGERVVVFHQETKDSIILNPTGSWLWNELDAPRRVSWLVEKLSAQHPDVPGETIKNDISAYLQELVKAKILVEQP